MAYPTTMKADGPAEVEERTLLLLVDRLHAELSAIDDVLDAGRPRPEPTEKSLRSEHPTAEEALEESIGDLDRAISRIQVLRGRLEKLVRKLA